ncbi:MAG TPA: hypothetical protein VKB88_31030 [Bryobacteraceae bacterium]|nr:hypothetical protein [Bryobacteraceae bacterium]
MDDVIEPAATRGWLAELLETLSTKRDWRPQDKHGLIPLRAAFGIYRRTTRL